MSGFNIFRKREAGSGVRHSVYASRGAKIERRRKWKVEGRGERERDSRTTQRSQVSITVNANVPSNHILQLHRHILSFPSLLSGIRA